MALFSCLCILFYYILGIAKLHCKDSEFFYTPLKIPEYCPAEILFSILLGCIYSGFVFSSGEFFFLVYGFYS